MPRRRFKPEEIVAKLRQVDVLVSQGQNMADAIRQIGVSEVTFYRWRQEFGGLKSAGEAAWETRRRRACIEHIRAYYLALRRAACLSRLQTTSTGGLRACFNAGRSVFSSKSFKGG